MKPKKKPSKGIVLIRKSNDLIESRFKFDVWEMRIFLMLIAQIKREDDDFNIYRIWYRDVANVFNLNKHRGYDMLRQAVKNLMSKSFFVRYNEGGKLRETQYHILRKINYSLLEGEESAESQEYVDIKIEEEMKPFLLQLQKSFTTYDLKNIVHLGVYSIRIYELLKQYEPIGHRAFGFEELKIMFELEKEYPRFATFYQRIIEPAVLEICKYSDLDIYEVEKLKEGKKVAGVRFSFRLKNAQNLLNEPQNTYDKNVKTIVADNVQTDTDTRFTTFYSKIVENLGVTPTVFMDLLKNYSDGQFEQAIRVTNRAKMDGQIKSNASGFFVQALKNGYTDGKEERVKKQKKEATKQNFANQMTALEIEKENQIFDRIKLLTAKSPQLTTEAIKFLKASAEGKKAIRNEETALGRSLDIEDYRQNKILRSLVIDKLININMDKFSDIFIEFDAKIALFKETNIF